MKKILALLLMIGVAGAAVAQEPMADRLRKAIVEEEAGQNLDKAIDAYKDILVQYDEHRRIVATALFHLADCYRKIGKKEPAIAAYRRLLREFPEQEKLADASSNYLASAYGIRTQQDPVVEKQAEGIGKFLQALTPSESMMNMEIEMIKKRVEMTLQNIELTERQIRETQTAVDTGAISPLELYPLEKELLSLQERLSDMQLRLRVYESQIKK